MSKFNQYSHDYLLESINSKPKKDIAEVAYLRLTTPLGSYFDDPTLGSNLYKLKRSKDLPRIRGQAIEWAKQALEPMRDEFYLTDISVNALDAKKKGHFAISAQMTTADGQKHETHINVKVAG